jgi:mannonate dehydratase
MAPESNSRRSFIKTSTSIAALSALGLESNGSIRELIRDAAMKMSLSYFYGYQKNKLQYARQMGIKGAVTSANPWMAGMRDRKSWEYEPLAALKERFAQEGLEFLVVEGPPGLEKTKLGLDGRDEELDQFIRFMQNMNKAGLDIICYNWMPVISWHRTTMDRKSRGDALVTAFDYEAIKDQPLTEYGEVSEEKMWDNITYFLKAVVPEAEKLGIRLALHPDDPPIPKIRGISRIMTSTDAFKRLIEIYPSPSNGLTFCQGTFATMGEDIPSAIRYFGKRDKIFFVHFRDIRGNKWNFEETFHDDGITDMHEAMNAYYEVGFRGPIRPDHVPTMAGDNNDHPGYSVLGTLYAMGYIRGLMEATYKSKT